jgi:7 transmembrane sweet-taste receptor of 3 GCPR
MLSTKAYVNPEIECIHVSDLDLVLSFGAIFFTNLIVLICWTTISPLQWDREYSSSTDTFGRPNETYARCTSDNEAVYWSLLAAFNLGVLVLCNWWAYRSRNIETEYNESSFVGVSAAAVLQAWAMGIPIIIVVVSDSPQAAFYVATGIVFVTAQALISLIYIPKVIALRKARKEELEKRKLESFRAHKNSGSKGGDDDEHDENGERHHDELSGGRTGPIVEVGATVSTIPMSTEASREINPQDPLSGTTESVPPDEDGVGELSNHSSNAFPLPSRDDLRSTKSDPQAISKHVVSGRGMPHTVSWSPGLEVRQHSTPIIGAGGDAAAAGDPDDSTTAGREGSASFRQRRRRPTNRKSISMLSLRRLSVFSGGSASSSSNSLVAPGSPTGGATGGTRILHNPRSQRSLAVSGGYEVSRQQLEVLMQCEDAPGGLDSLELYDETALNVPDGQANGGGDGTAPHNDSNLILAMEALDEEDEGNGGDFRGDDNGEVAVEGTNGHKSSEGV